MRGQTRGQQTQTFTTTKFRDHLVRERQQSPLSRIYVGEYAALIAKPPGRATEDL